MKYKFLQGFGLFIQDKEAECSLRTVEYYRSCIKYFINFWKLQSEILIEDLYLDEVTASDLKQYVIHLRNKNKFEGNLLVDATKVHKSISKTSIQTYQRGIKVFFHYCYVQELMEYDITKNYKLIRRESKEKIPLFANEVEQIEKLYNPKAETGSRNLAILHLMLDAGARLNEVLTLKICNVMFDKNLLLLDGKGSKERIVPLGKRLKKYLYDYLVKYRKISIDQQGNLVNYRDDLVFLSIRTREPLTKTGITMMFNRIKRLTGINRVHAHLLRHTFATSYILCGGDIKSLQIYMGHSDISTTSIYLHLANKYMMINADVYRLDIIKKLGDYM